MSMEPALLPGGQVVAAGKAGLAYLLSSVHLGGIGGQRAVLRSVCGQDIAGGSAVSRTTIYLPCAGGIVAVRAARSPAALGLLWRSGAGGGPPIVAAGLIWTIGPDGTLTGLEPATGKVRQRAAVGALANHFPTPSVGDGLLLAAAARNVVAFAAPAAGTSASATPTSAPAPAPGTGPGTVPASHSARPDAAGGGTLPPGAVAAIVAGSLAAAGAVGWLAWRRRAGRTSAGKHGRD